MPTTAAHRSLMGSHGPPMTGTLGGNLFREPVMHAFDGLPVSRPQRAWTEAWNPTSCPHRLVQAQSRMQVSLRSEACIMLTPSHRCQDMFWCNADFRALLDTSRPLRGGDERKPSAAAAAAGGERKKKRPFKPKQEEAKEETDDGPKYRFEPPPPFPRVHHAHAE